MSAVLTRALEAKERVKFLLDFKNSSCSVPMNGDEGVRKLLAHHKRPSFVSPTPPHHVGAGCKVRHGGILRHCACILGASLRRVSCQFMILKRSLAAR